MSFAWSQQSDRPKRQRIHRATDKDIPTSDIACIINLSTPSPEKPVPLPSPGLETTHAPQKTPERLIVRNQPKTPKMLSSDEEPVPVPLPRTATKKRPQGIDEQVLLRDSQPQRLFRIRVRFDVRGCKAHTILVPVLTPNDKNFNPNERTVEWLMSEATRRFSLLNPKKRVKVSHLMTEDDVSLFPEDLVMETLEDYQLLVAVE